MNYKKYYDGQWVKISRFKLNGVGRIKGVVPFCNSWIIQLSTASNGLLKSDNYPFSFHLFNDMFITPLHKFKIGDEVICQKDLESNKITGTIAGLDQLNDQPMYYVQFTRNNNEDFLHAFREDNVLLLSEYNKELLKINSVEECNYKVGDLVKIVNKHSKYFNLKGNIVESHVILKQNSKKYSFYVKLLNSSESMLFFSSSELELLTNNSLSDGNLPITKSQTLSDIYSDLEKKDKLFQINDIVIVKAYKHYRHLNGKKGQIFDIDTYRDLVFVKLSNGNKYSFESKYLELVENQFKFKKDDNIMTITELKVGKILCCYLDDEDNKRYGIRLSDGVLNNFSENDLVSTNKFEPGDFIKIIGCNPPIKGKIIMIQSSYGEKGCKREYQIQFDDGSKGLFSESSLELDNSYYDVIVKLDNSYHDVVEDFLKKYSSKKENLNKLDTSQFFFKKGDYVQVIGGTIGGIDEPKGIILEPYFKDKNKRYALKLTNNVLCNIHEDDLKFLKRPKYKLGDSVKIIDEYNKFYSLNGVINAISSNNLFEIKLNFNNEICFSWLSLDKIIIE